MISREKELRLIAIYLYICDLYDSTLKFECQRFSNNAKPDFTDQELMTIYLFAGYEQRYFQVNEIHSFTKDYLLDWFPKLPSYQTFSYRLNLLTGAFQALANILISSFKPEGCSDLFSIVDSMPVITSGSKNRTGKVAPEITAKGFCSTKNLFYYGCKIHTMASVRVGTIPFPESMIITPAKDSDLTVFKQAWGDKIFSKVILGDKIYSDKEYFNWLYEKAKIQRAMKVRSTAGLLIHLFGKLSMLSLI